MPDKPPEQDATPNEPKLAWAQFLELAPPNQFTQIPNLGIGAVSGSIGFNYGDIELFCPNEKCNGRRSFEHQSGAPRLSVTGWEWDFVVYRCRNCREAAKHFAVATKLGDERLGAEVQGTAIKLGEWPPFGPHTPARVLRLIQDDRELFLLGRRAESQGMGIAAFAYYRRVIENQKNRLFDKLIEIAGKLGIDQAQIKQLQEDRDNPQFARASDTLKGVAPRELQINGHNPMQLLHRALSEGLHGKSDGECLELASTIRLVLVEFAERLAAVLREHRDLDQALSRLLNPANKTKS